MNYHKRQEIRLKSGDIAISEDDKQWIIQEIQNINFLREENIRKVNALNKQLGERDLKIADLQNEFESYKTKFKDSKDWENKKYLKIDEIITKMRKKYNWETSSSIFVEVINKKN